MTGRRHDRGWGRRTLALVLAYLLALSGLLGAVAAAQATGARTGGFATVLCHHEPGSGPAGSDPAEHNSAHDDDCCGVGCLMMAPVLPPPDPAAVPVRHSALLRLDLRVASPAFDRRIPTPRQSRAPPRAV